MCTYICVWFNLSSVASPVSCSSPGPISTNAPKVSTEAYGADLSLKNSCSETSESMYMPGGRRVEVRQMLPKPSYILKNPYLQNTTHWMLNTCDHLKMIFKVPKLHSLSGKGLFFLYRQKSATICSTVCFSGEKWHCPNNFSVQASNRELLILSKLFLFSLPDLHT